MEVSLASSKSDAEALIKNTKYLALHFFAEWVDQCKNMNDVLTEMTSLKDYARMKFAKIPAEDVPEVSLQYKVVAVPTVILFKNGVQKERVEGANPAELRDKILNLLSLEKGAILEQRLKSLISMAPVMLFMKGNPEQPRCGFSRQIVEILRSHNANFKTFDILNDQEVREALKEYSKWPTYPQLYINGELVGGLDIIKELNEDGELKQMLSDNSLEDRLKNLVNSSHIMLFMKGNRDAPQCGFSRQIIEILNQLKAQYKTFDILTDETVRQGLKSFSNWPTYPQLYVMGQLVGGLDIVKEMKESGELQQMLPK